MSAGTGEADGAHGIDNRKSLGVRGRLLLAFLSVSMFSLVAAITGINSISQVGRSLDQITERRVPETLAWQELSRSIERVVLAAPALLAVDTEAKRQEVSDGVFSQMEKLSALLADARRYIDLEDENYLLDGAIDIKAAADRAVELVARINENFVSIDKFVADRLELNARRDKVLSRLARGHANAQRIVSPSARILDSNLRDWENGTGRDAGTELTLEQAELARSIIASLPEQRAASLFDTFDRQINLIAEASTVEQVDLLTFPPARTLADLKELVAELRVRARRRLEKQIEVFERLTDGPDGLPEIRKAELEAIGQAKQLLGLNTRLSSFLNNRAHTLVKASNERIENANREAFQTRVLNRNILLTVVLLSIISSLLIVWLYVSRNLIARLSALSNSMLAIAGGPGRNHPDGAGLDWVPRHCDRGGGKQSARSRNSTATTD